MSEVLRAIFDKNAIDARVAFYCAQFVTPLAGTALVASRRQASIACKRDTWFLAMGASFDAGFTQAAPPLSRWENKAVGLTFQIQRANTGEVYSMSPQQQALQNYNLNNWVTWDEYIPFGPAELIQVNADIWTNYTGGIVQTEYSFVTLMGVEYQMPSGVGDGYGA